jgi:hypothetical protein
MASRRRAAQVTFFEVRAADGTPFESPIDWQSLFSYIARQGIAQREHSINGLSHWGKIYPYKEQDHFLLARERDDMSSLDLSKDEIIDTESDVTSPYVEVTFAHFVSGTNVLGMVLGSNAAPRVSSIAAWFNEHKLIDQEIEIVPFIDPRILEKIHGAASAKLVRVTFQADPVESVRRSSSLAEAAHGLHERVGEVEISLELRVESGASEGAASRILAEAQSLASSNAFKKAFATLVQVNEEGKLYREDVDFLDNRLAFKTKIITVDASGKSVRVHSAIDAILKAVEKHRRDLPPAADPAKTE